jgi:glycosyltransferase involved in cell wall biosynthesis
MKETQKYENTRYYLNMSCVVTVVFCTHNRSHHLETLFEYEKTTKIINELAQQLKILVIVNGSNQDHENNYRRISKKLTNFELIIEEKSGLSNARNLAIEMTDTKYIYFLDDDLIIPEVFWKNLIHLISDQEFILIGGPVKGLVQNDIPNWYQTAWNDRNYAEDVFEQRRYSGGNFGGLSEYFRKYNFDVKKGMNANKISIGEERDFIEQLLHHYPNNRRLYSPMLSVFEPILIKKGNFSYRLRREFANGYNTKWHPNEISVSIIKQLCFRIYRLFMRLISFYKKSIMRLISFYKKPINYFLKSYYQINIERRKNHKTVYFILTLSRILGKIIKKTRIK